MDFLRDIGKHFPVNQMLSREVVRARLEAGGISYTEFSYQILQANDYLELHNRYGCTLQLGGSDQWGNLVSGVDLIRRVTGDTVHALATPLITKPDGTKYGKTEGEAVWLSPDLMSPYAFYQFWLNRSDAEVPGLLRVFSFRSRAEIEELEREIAERPAATAGAAAAGRGTDGPGARRRPSWPGCRRRARRCSARATCGRWTRRRWRLRWPRCRTPSLTVAAGGAAAGGRPDGGDRDRGEQVGRPARDRRGRRVPQQRQGHGRGRRAGRDATCCTASSWCCGAGSGPSGPCGCAGSDRPGRASPAGLSLPAPGRVYCRKARPTPATEPARWRSSRSHRRGGPVPGRVMARADYGE